MSGQYSGTTRSVARPATACRTSRTSSNEAREASSSACGTSTSQLATRALSTVASRSPPTDSLRSGTEEWASSPEQVGAPGHQLVQLGQPLTRIASPLVEQRRAQSQGQVGVAGQVPGVEQPERHPRIGRGLLVGLGRGAHRVVDVGSGVPQRVPEARGPVCPARRSRRGPARGPGRCTAPAPTRPYPPTATRATPTSGRPTAEAASRHNRSAACVRPVRSAALTLDPPGSPGRASGAGHARSSRLQVAVVVWGSSALTDRWGEATGPHRS